ncbi:alkanesulfonate monooxygenase SsuD/methylene tetrahydromethanopterin reductase-like flavin-dependent oxidoreductase (luciferase family) [Novosphingobium sp. SG720]|nr:alkanesulfonate monooxygenase SsuD/methylene tetrahydromethanopterin reductase-like flavin-dependent oxidoreductase (luciferase family) [Novosphingobium sp. SG720]
MQLFRNDDGTVPNVGSQRLLDAAAGGRVRDKRLWTEIAALTGGSGNSTALVGTAEQVAESLLDYYDLGIDTFLIRGFDPLEDAIEYGRDLLPLVRAAVAERDMARVAAE